MSVSYAIKLVLRNPRRTFTYLFGLALAVGLFAGILFFVDVITRQMTTTALAPVRIDMIARAVKPDMNVSDIVTTLTGQRNISAAEPVISADFSSASKVGSNQISPAGRLFALSPGYFNTFDVLQLSQGAFDPTGVVVSEAMATVQKLKIGDIIQMTFAGVTDSVNLPITGIVNMDTAEAMFVTPTGAEGSVFADVVLVDLSWFHDHLQNHLLPLAMNMPASILPTTTVMDMQVHIKINRATFPADPATAALQSAALQREIERPFPGQVKVLDNVSRAFKSAMSDVLTAKILFVFLGLPGVALSAYLSKFAAELFAEAQRRELGLLRTRGATPRQIAGIIAVTSLLLALMGSALGIVVGVLALIASNGRQALEALNPFAMGFDWTAFAKSAGIAFAAGIVLTFFAAFLPVFGAMNNEITQERRRVRRADKIPFWKRAYLDVILIGAAIVILVITQANGGFSMTGAEGATLSLSFYIFLAPFFAWMGLTLLVLRLVERGLSSMSRGLTVLFKHVLGDIGEVAGKSISRRASNISAATTIIALTLSFGISLALFQYTYTTEKQRDAQYVAGSDIRFAPSLNAPQTADFAQKLMLPGVTDVTGIVRDPQALVGSSNQSVYGIDVPSFKRVAYAPDTFFVDGTAQKTIDAINSQVRSSAIVNYAPSTANKVLDVLSNTPNGVLLAVDQAQKFNILVGDSVLLRLFNPKTKQFADVKTVAVGMFLQFPTSSQDSDFILNRDFMLKTIGSDAMTFFLIKTDEQAGTVARVSEALKAQFKAVMPFRIDSIDTVVNVDASSLTAMNLTGLGTMELLYTLLVISVGLAIFLLAMINERQREFGAMRALGANLNHLRRFLFAEAATIGGLSLMIGVVVGFGLARMLVLLLGVIFTVPTTTLEVPWTELIVLGVLVIVAMVLSTLISSRRLATLKVVEALREL